MSRLPDAGQGNGSAAAVYENGDFHNIRLVFGGKFETFAGRATRCHDVVYNQDARVGGKRQAAPQHPLAVFFFRI